MKTPDEIKKALECHKDGSACHDCPYEQGRTFSVDGVTFGCSQEIVADALAYIERLESRAEPKNRVLTLEEVLRGKAMWYEERTRQVARMVILGYAQNEPGFTKLIGYLADGFYRRDDAYNDFWRCWLRKPTEAERRETPWGGEGHV